MLNMRERDKGVDSTMHEYILSPHDVQHCDETSGNLTFCSITIKKLRATVPGALRHAFGSEGH